MPIPTRTSRLPDIAAPGPIGASTPNTITGTIITATNSFLAPAGSGSAPSFRFPDEGGLPVGLFSAGGSIAAVVSDGSTSEFAFFLLGGPAPIAEFYELGGISSVGLKIGNAGTTGKVGFYGATPVARAAAIAAPTAPSASYVQAEAQSMKTAVDAIRVALTNIGITL